MSLAWLVVGSSVLPTPTAFAQTLAEPAPVATVVGNATLPIAAAPFDPLAAGLEAARGALRAADNELGGLLPARMGPLLDQQRANLEVAEALLRPDDVLSSDPFARSMDATKKMARWQAATVGVAWVEPEIARHDRLIDAARELARRYAVNLTPSQEADVAALDALDPPLRDALRDVFDAFLALDTASRDAYARVDPLLLAEARSPIENASHGAPNASQPRAEAPFSPQDLGLDLSRILPARDAVLEAVETLKPAAEAAAGSAPAGAMECLGTIRVPPAFILGSLCNDSHDWEDDAALVIDWGLTGDSYGNNGGGTRWCTYNSGNINCWNWFPAALLFDLAGSDSYHGSGGSFARNVNGGGALGVGMLVDASGDDWYGFLDGDGRVWDASNGGARLGAGLLIDAIGNDQYWGTTWSVNGGGGGGVGLLVDGLGDDTYSGGWMGSNGGGNLGVGSLVDLGGSDTYAALEYYEGTTMGAGSNGGGMDGVGFLLDAAGDDRYAGQILLYAGTTKGGSQGLNGGGYGLGSGFLLDALGNDTYVGETDGVNGGSRGGAGSLIDLTGNDQYVANGQGANGEWGFLYDGQGGDWYENPRGVIATDATVVPKGVLGFQIDSGPPGVSQDPDGLCTVYVDSDGDATSDPPESVARAECPTPWFNVNPDGTVTVWNDRDRDRMLDPGEETLRTPVADPRIRDDPDGSCTLYNDANRNGVVDANETLQSYACPKPSLRTGSNGEQILYDDKNDNAAHDAGEELLIAPALDPQLSDNLDGTCTLYNDADHDDWVDDAEALLTYSCPRLVPRPEPLNPARARPPRPDPPADALRSFETVLNETNPAPSIGSDWDADGLPDLLDAVNLPSEARQLTVVGDKLSLPDGLGAQGFALLVEPRHQEAVLAWADPLIGPLVPPVDDFIAANESLDLVGDRFGPVLRDALALLLHENLTVRLVTRAPEVPLNVTLAWAGGAVPADGSWLLVRSDPARRLSVVLGGSPVDLAAQLASHYAPTPDQDLRWEFLNLHGAESYCYDPATPYHGSTCRGERWYGGVRAYSGQAAYALSAVAAGLRRGLVPLTTDGLLDATTPVSGSLDPPRDHPVVDVFDPASPWHVPGNQSKAWPAGAGVDYDLVDDASPRQPLIRQAAALIDLEPPLSPRRFVYEARLVRLDATPRDLAHLQVGIRPADGNESGHEFILNGKTLANLLNLQAGESWSVTGGEEVVGVVWRQEDVDADGFTDVVVSLPHFSQQWIFVEPQQWKSVDFWDVEVTSPTTAWLTGDGGAVWRYTNGHLTKVPINNGLTANQRTLGMHLLSDSEFWVAGQSDCSSPDGQAHGPFLAHRRPDASWQVYRFITGFECNDLNDVWMRSDGQLGYAGGSMGLWLEYQPDQWVAKARPAPPAGILDVELDAAGAGYVSLSDASNAIRRYDASGFTAASDGTVSGNVYDVESAGGRWAVGSRPSQGGPGVFERKPGGWTQANFVPPQWNQPGRVDQPPDWDYFGVASQPGAKATWFTAFDARDHDARLVVENQDDVWSAVGLGYAKVVQDVGFAPQALGLAVGQGAVFQYWTNVPPVASGVLDRLVGTRLDTFTGNKGTTYDPNPQDTLTYQWEWGDGASSYGDPTSHKFADITRPGEPFKVQFTATDNHGDRASQEFSVTVDPAPLQPGVVASDSFSDARRAESHAWVLPAAATARGVEVEVTGGARVTVAGSLDRTAWPALSWPNAYGTAKKLTGLVPAGTPLIVVAQHPEGESALSYSVIARVLSAPTVTLPNPVPNPYHAGRGDVLSLTLGAHAGLQVAVEVDWRDGSTVERWPRDGGLRSPGAIQPVSHAYSAPGSYAVRVRAVDSLGVPGAWVETTLAARTIASGVVDAPTGVGTAAATMQGTVTSLGGSPWVRASFVVYRGGVEVARSAVQQVSTAPVALAGQAVSGFQPAMEYSIRLLLENDVAWSDASARSFSTAVSTPVLPSFSQGPSVSGKTVSLSLQADRPSPSNVAYQVRWGDGTTERVPLSGFAAWNQPHSASHAYAFASAWPGHDAGAYPFEVVLLDAEGRQSAPVPRPVIVSGSAPLAFSTTAGLDTVTLRATLSSIPAGSDPRVRFSYQSPATPAWTSSATLVPDANRAVAWTTGTLNRVLEYDVRVELSANGGSGWWEPQAWPDFHTNWAPTLLPIETGDRSLSYLDQAGFGVTYRDPEGDAPSGGAPQVTVGGSTFTMHAPYGAALDAPAFQAGVTYSYNVASLSSPQNHQPVFAVGDQYQAAPSAAGGRVLVKQSHVTAYDFEQDPVGASPSGFTREPSDNENLWRVANVTDGSHPAVVATGGHQKAAWFGHPSLGHYASPQGKVTRGSLVSPAYDLGTLKNPVLSFSSWYETEDVNKTRDKKLVEVRARAGIAWGPWTPLHQVSGYEGGYLAWRTVAVPLSAYAGKVVQVRFTFDAVDNQHNGYRGWYVDDVVVGHDHESDGLADELERRRSLIQVAPPGLPLRIEDGATKTYYFELAERTKGHDVPLHALIQTTRPRNLEIDLSIEHHAFPNPGPVWTETVPVFSPAQGDRHACQPSRLPGFVGEPPAGAAFEERTDGLRIRLNLAQCGLDASQQGPFDRWYLRIRDVLDSASASFQAFQLLDAGKTGLWLSDTDFDLRVDGQDSGAHADPLGADAPGDAVWVPAVALGSEDWGRYVEIRLDGVPSTAVIPDGAWAWTASGNQSLRPQASPGPGRHRYDAVPGATTYDFFLRGEDGLGLRVTVGVNDDPNGEVSPVRLAAVLSARGLLHSYNTTVSPLAVDNVGDWLFLNTFEDLDRNLLNYTVKQFLKRNVAGSAKGSWVANGVGFGLGVWRAVEVVHVSNDYLVWDKLVRAAVRNAPLSQVLKGDAWFLVPDSVRQAATSRGFNSVSELVTAVENAKLAVTTDPHPAARWFFQLNDGLAAFEARGPLVVGAWKWAQTSTWDTWPQPNQVPLGSVVEREVWGGQTLLPNGNLLRATHCLAYCEDRGGSQLIFVDATGSTTNDKQRRDEGELNVPAEFFLNLRAGFQAFDRAKKPIEDRVADATIGQLGLEYTSKRAFQGELQSRVTTYWDNAPADEATYEQHCQGNPQTDPDIRRCSNFVANRPASFSENVAWNGPGVLKPIGADWRKQDSDPWRFRDRLTAKGQVYPGQAGSSVGGAMVPDAYQARVWDAYASNPPSTIQGDAVVTYDWSTDAPAALVGFKRIV